MTAYVRTDNNKLYRLEDVKCVTYTHGQVLITYVLDGDTETTRYSESSLKDGLITFM